MDITAIFLKILVLLPGLVVAITLHEAAHGYVASWLGDQTARRMGRLSLNPIRHIDPVGTLLIPGVLFLLNAPFLFGWAKPVPVDYRNLRNPRKDMAWIALAGPSINMLIALVSSLLIYVTFLVPDPVGRTFTDILVYSILINCVIAVINFLPIPPLDGGRILVGVLPERMAWRVARLEAYGFPILITLIFLLPMALQPLGINFDPFGQILGPLIKSLGNSVLSITGHAPIIR